MRLLGALVTVGKSCNVRMLDLFWVDWNVKDDDVSFEGTFGRMCHRLAGKGLVGRTGLVLGTLS